MDRRTFLLGAGTSAFVAALARSEIAAAADGTSSASTEFSWDWLNAHARELAKTPFDPSSYQIPKELTELYYDDYRQIRYKDEKAIWRGEPSAFQLELFHLGYLFRDPVHIYVVEGDRATELRYDKDLYRFGHAEKRKPMPEQIDGFSGFRVHKVMENPGVFDEFLVFQGASYFRGRPKGATYGLSARGLAINTVQPGGEEFPGFRAFWLTKPKPGENTITIYALLNSISITGAYRFVVTAPDDVAMEVECTLYPRSTIAHGGIAAFSSMFFYGPADHTRHDDFRPQVHDSDGLGVLTSYGEWLWRPLITGRQIQYSMFSGGTPGGFGLLQRDREFEHYEDLGAGYERRPGAWVEPLSDWGEGSVDLVELPTAGEYDDNIVAFWRPAKPWEPGQTYNYRYRLTWAAEIPVKRDVAKVVQTRGGQGLKPGARLILIDFVGGQLYADANEEMWDYVVSASAGYIKAYTVGPNQVLDGKRIAIEYYPDGDKVADLKFQIRSMGKPLSEKWVYRWVP